MGSKTRLKAQGFTMGKLKTQNVWRQKSGEVEAAAEETPSLTGEFVGETHRGLERAQAYPLGNQHQRGPI